MKTSLRSKSILFILPAFLTSQFFLVPCLSIAQDDGRPRIRDVSAILNVLREHTSYGLNDVDFNRTLRFIPHPSLAFLRNPFEQSIQAPSSTAGLTPDVGMTFTYSTATVDPSAPMGSGQTLSHTRSIGEPSSIFDAERSVTDQPRSRTLFEPSSYFLFDTNVHSRRSLALAPLRMDESLMIVAASTGYQENRNKITDDHKEGIPGPAKVPRHLMLMIGVRADEIDDLSKASIVSGKEIAQYNLRLNTMTQTEREQELRSQLSAIKDFPEFSRYLQSYSPLNINTQRVNYNLVARDIQGEVQDLITKAAAGIPGFEIEAQRMLKAGGFGITQTRHGHQYIIFSLAIPVITSTYPTSLDVKIAEFVKALIDPDLKLNKRIRIPNDLDRAKQLLEKMKRNRATADMATELESIRNGASAQSEAKADNAMAELMGRLNPGAARGGGVQPSCKAVLQGFMLK